VVEKKGMQRYKLDVISRRISRIGMWCCRLMRNCNYKSALILTPVSVPKQGNYDQVRNRETLETGSLHPNASE